MSSAVWYCTQRKKCLTSNSFLKQLFSAPSPCGPCGLAARFGWISRLRPHQVEQIYRHMCLFETSIFGQKKYVVVHIHSFPQVVGEVHQNHKWKSEWHFIIFWELNSLVNLLSYLVFPNWIVENLVFLFGENTILPERGKVDRASNLTRSLLSSKLGNKHRTTNSTKPISFLKNSSWKQPILQRWF